MLTTVLLIWYVVRVGMQAWWSAYLTQQWHCLFMLSLLAPVLCLRGASSLKAVALRPIILLCKLALLKFPRGLLRRNLPLLLRESKKSEWSKPSPVLLLRRCLPNLLAIRHVIKLGSPDKKEFNRDVHQSQGTFSTMDRGTSSSPAQGTHISMTS